MLYLIIPEWFGFLSEVIMKASESKKMNKLQVRYQEQMRQQRKICNKVEDESDDKYSVFSVNPIWIKAKKNITALQRRIDKLRNKLYFDIKRLREETEKELSSIENFDGIITQ